MTQLRTVLRRHRALVAVTVLQATCAIYFVFDVTSELPELRTHSVHPLLEMAVVAVLFVGTLFGLREIRAVVRQNSRMESSLRVASGAFLDLLEECFERWGLTPSERDVALLAIKGLSVAEIAHLRGTREGTVKAQCTAVYRKAGVSNRAQLLSLFVDDLMAGVPLGPAEGPEPGPPPRGTFAG